MQRREFIISTASGALVPSLRPGEAQDIRWERDGVGTVARFGVLTPDFDPVPESEMWVMAPPGVSVHGARVPRGAPGPRAFAEPPHVDEAVDRLVRLGPRAILFAYTSSTYALGAAADRQVQARLEQRAGGVPVILTCGAAAAAVRALGATRISLVHPPWFSESSNDQGAAYWRDAGFEVVRSTRLQPNRSFTEVAPAELFEFVTTDTPSTSEAVFIGGNGLRAIGAIRALEERLRRPVLSANQVLFWAALRAVGGVEGSTAYGRIFRTGSPGP
jgi:maleate isomerase